MHELICSDSLLLTRKSRRRICHARELDPAEILRAVALEGEVLKQSHKCQVRRISSWVIKETNVGAVSALRHTFQGIPPRRAWLAAHHLRRNGIPVPEPIAYIERGLFGLVTSAAMVSAFLEGHRNVEKFLTALTQRGAGVTTISTFLDDLACAVNALCASGAYHQDLSGKNIYTADGATFFFIDLDAVELGKEYTDERRMKNHVQLYDSFCDSLNDGILVPFIEKMLLPRHDARVWMPLVRKAQKLRRMRAERKA